MVRLFTLGSIDLRDGNGTELRTVLVQPRRLALLVYLVLSRPYGFQRRDRLLALFWPDEAAERARASLSRAVYLLRQTLGPEVVPSRGVGDIGLDRERLWCDAAAFEAALAAGDPRRALELYRGDLMPGFFVTGVPEFEQWLEGERARLRTRAAEAAASLVVAEESASKLEAAAHWARRAVELTPFDEIAVRRLLLLLDRMGDRAGAVQAYREFDARLGIQLGIVPAPETTRLCEVIRARQSGTDPKPSPEIEREDSPAQPSQVPVPIGRRASYRTGVLVSVAALAAGFLLVRPKAIDRLRVDVARFENRTGDASLGRLETIVAEQVFEGLAQSGLIRPVPGTPAGMAWRNQPNQGAATAASRTPRGRAGTVVSGVYDRAGNVVRIRVRITDHQRGGRVWEIGPVSGSPAEVASLLAWLRPRVAGAVAVLDDSYYASLLPLVTTPPTMESWLEFREGLRLDSARQSAEARVRFRLAAALDTTFTWPLVHAALSGLRSASSNGVEVDSLLRELEVVRHRLSPLEHRLVEYMLAARVEDWERCYRAIREAAAIAPDQFSYTQAIRALTLQRPREAVTALTREHLDSIYRDDVRNYWSVLTLAYHQLGEHRMELATARKARQPAPANASLLSHEIRALAAMGRIAAVRARTDSLLALPRDGWFTPGVALMQIGSELRAHGHMAAAAEILSRAVAWYRSRPPVEVETETHGYFLGWTLIVAGRFSEADSVFAGLHSDHPKNPEYVGYLGALAARRGDRARALRLAAQLEGREVETPIPGELSIVNRARIAILLGDTTRAMRLLIEAFGPQGTMELHGDPDFDGMKDYPPFREFIRPKG